MKKTKQPLLKARALNEKESFAVVKKNVAKTIRRLERPVKLPVFNKDWWAEINAESAGEIKILKMVQLDIQAELYKDLVTYDATEFKDYLDRKASDFFSSLPPKTRAAIATFCDGKFLVPHKKLKAT